MPPPMHSFNSFARRLPDLASSALRTALLPAIHIYTPLLPNYCRKVVVRPVLPPPSDQRRYLFDLWRRPSSRRPPNHIRPLPHFIFTGPIIFISRSYAYDLRFNDWTFWINDPADDRGTSCKHLALSRRMTLSRLDSYRFRHALFLGRHACMSNSGACDVTDSPILSDTSPLTPHSSPCHGDLDRPSYPRSSELFLCALPLCSSQLCAALVPRYTKSILYSSNTVVSRCCH